MASWECSWRKYRIGFCTVKRRNHRRMVCFLYTKKHVVTPSASVCRSRRERFFQDGARNTCESLSMSTSQNTFYETFVPFPQMNLQCKVVKVKVKVGRMTHLYDFIIIGISGPTPCNRYKKYRRREKALKAYSVDRRCLLLYCHQK